MDPLNPGAEPLKPWQKNPQQPPLPVDSGNPTDLSAGGELIDAGVEGVSAGADVLNGIADVASGTLEAAGNVAGGCAEGCGGCSLAVLLMLFASAGTAMALFH